MLVAQWTRRRLTHAALGIGLILGIVPTNAQTTSNWISPTGGTFSDDGNWDAGVPGMDDVAEIALPGAAFSVDFTNSVSNDRLLLRSGNVTFNLGGNTYELLNPESGQFATDVSVHVGMQAGDDALLTLLGGSLLSNKVHIADSAGSKGAIEVGANAIWNNAVGFYIGVGGEGAMVVRDGGSVSTAFATALGLQAGSEGTLTITGSDGNGNASNWNGDLIVGFEGRGIAKVEDGALAVAPSAYFGVSAGAQGAVDVTGTDGNANPSQLLMAVTGVGDKGEGELNITGGGAATTLIWGFIGARAGSQGTATVSGAGSSWTVGSSLFVGGKQDFLATQEDESDGVPGEYGDATLIVSDGGVAMTGALAASRADLLGNGLILTGGVLLDDYDIVFDSAQKMLTFGASDEGVMQVDLSAPVPLLGAGHKGVGSITITNGLAVSSEEATLGNLAGSHGTATVTGPGTSWATQELRVGRFGSGTLDISDGATMTSNMARIGQNTGASGAVTVGSGSQWTNQEVVFVGERGTGSLTVEAGATVETRTLLASIGDLHGGGEIHTRGLVVDGLDLQFDSTHGLQQTFAFGSGGQLHLDLTGPSPGILGVGYHGEGTMTISEGREVFTEGNSGVGAGTSGAIGWQAGSNGSVLVTGVDDQGNRSTWRATHGIHVGLAGTGSLTVADGALVDAGISVIALETGSKGTVTVIGSERAGEPTTWVSFGGLSVGTVLGNHTGQGRIDVLNGGFGFAGSNLPDLPFVPLPTISFGDDSQVNVSGSVVDVEGVLKQSFFYAGGILQMFGDMNVTDGGRFVTRGISELGNTSGNPAVATIRGSDSLGNESSWVAQGGMLVGWYGPAVLNIEDGAHVATSYAGLATAFDSEGETIANVTGTNGNGVPSRWELLDNLYVGGFTLTGETDSASLLPNPGTLNITAGGLVTSKEGWISINGVTGTVNVVGQGGGLTSTWSVSERLRVGIDGIGQLNILDGGFVSSASGYVGELSGGSGSVTVSGAGSLWSVTGDLVLGGSSLADDTPGNGTLTVRDGGVVEVGGSFKIHAGSELNGNGTVLGTIQTAGLISPGNSAGTLTVEGDVDSLSSAVLAIELGGSGVGAFDVLNILGTFHANGQLLVSLIDGFHPNGTESFTILMSAGVTGYFANAVPNFGDSALGVTIGDLTMDVTYDYLGGSIILTNVVPEPSSLMLLVAAGGLVCRKKRRIAS
jgi:fibronectin-binding autotransporter adhesin